MGEVAFALGAEELLDAARAEAGLDDFGGDTFRVGLDRVLTGLRDEARLNDVGRVMAPEVLRGYLVNRLEVTDWHRRHPEIGRAPVVPPIVMIGMGRTGTTILHDLLGQDPAHRIPLTWEVDRPCPPPEAATFDTDPRIAEAQARIDVLNQLHPEFQAMHPTGARLGQECIRYTGCEFTSLIFLSQFRMPAYLDWLVHEADLAPAYRWHRRFLQLLQWHHPRDRWVLKSGAHLWSLPELLAEYPDAWLIQTHRDPVRVIPSLSSLFATVRRTGSDDVSIAGVAAEWSPAILEALDRAVDARQDGTIRPEQVIDVQYQAFLADPIATIATLYDRWGVELTPVAAARMRAFLADHAQDRHGTHRYTLADSGLVEGELRERARRYTEYFDVTPEPAV